MSTSKLLEAAAGEAEDQLSPPTPFADGGGGCGGREVSAASTSRQYKTLKTASSNGPRQQQQQLRNGRAARDAGINREKPNANEEWQLRCYITFKHPLIRKVYRDRIKGPS